MPPTQAKKRYNTVCVGGTFNVLHRGHRTLLKRSFDLGRRVKIGLTSDRMAQMGRRGVELRPFEERKRALIEWLDSMGFEGRYTIETLYDTFGTAVEDKDCEAIIVSTETMLVAEEINTVRKERGMKELEIHIIPMVKAEDGTRLKSTRVLLGLHSPHGEIKRELVFAVGSGNEAKVMGAINAIRRMFIWTKRAKKGARILYGTVDSGVDPQPWDDGMWQGALNRAEAVMAKAFTSRLKAYSMDVEGQISGPVDAEVPEEIDFGIGIEAGIIRGYNGMAVGIQACTIIDRDGHISYGYSSGFPIPGPIAEALNNENLEDIIYTIYSVRNIGDSVGAVGLLSDGIITREEISEQCVLTSLIKWCRNYEKGENWLSERGNI